MKENIYLPNKIKVGFQERNDTFTGQLAYIIYYDNKGVLRKEKSWNNWRDSKIPSQEFENIPMSGFVLNKKVGGYKSDWNYRQSYLRIYDPRGFEFEITLENLVFILENTDCLRGKGLDGDFIYGWDGTELVLLPVNSEEYNNIKDFNKKVFNGIELKNNELKEGFTYINKRNEEYVYLGKYKYIEDFEVKGNRYFFKPNFGYESFSSINGKGFILKNEEVHPKYETFLNTLKTEESFGYFDPKFMYFEECSLDEFYLLLNQLNVKYNYYKQIIVPIKTEKNKFTSCSITNYNSWSGKFRYDYIIYFKDETINFNKTEVEKIFNEIKPYKFCNNLKKRKD